MPNLVGVCELGTPADVLQPVLQKMIDAVDLPAFSMARRSVCGRGVAVGNVLPGTEDNLSQPARDAERGVWLMLDGELWNAPDVARALRVEGVDASRLDDAQLALAAYRAWGESFVDRLQGPWNIVLHHEAERRTVVITDRIGSRLLFMARDGARVTFGS